MKTRRIVFQFIGFCGLGLCISLLFSCKPEEIILHGHLTGIVTDGTTGQPIQAAKIELHPSLYPKIKSTDTDSLGKYLFKGLSPGNYELEVSKFKYDTIRGNVYVREARINTADFTMEGIPLIDISTTSLDFMMDLIELPIYITNSGLGSLKLLWVVSDEDWISVEFPEEITDQKDSIIVTIDRSGFLIDSLYEGSILIISNAKEPESIEIEVFVNRSYYFTDERDEQQYKAVRIGNQWWMAENLNTGTKIDYIENQINQTHNDNIEKFCYDNVETNCDIYGGLYQWHEMMQYQRHDSEKIGTTQGICPDGWHIPTRSEWETLIDYLGGEEVAGGKMKTTGTIAEGDGLWFSPNEGATNSSGFSAKPGGYKSTKHKICLLMHEWAEFGSATGEEWDSEWSEYRSYAPSVYYSDPKYHTVMALRSTARSVRCVKDTPLTKK